VDTEPPTISAEQAERYRTEEQDVLERLQRSIRYYSNRIKFARAGHYTVGLITLVCSVLAPMAVITTARKPSDLSLFGISNETIAQLAVVLTLLLGLTEGVRRLFRFSERWMTCSTTRAKLNELMKEYKLSQIPVAVGSETWIKNLGELHKNIRVAEMEEEGGFFDRLKEPSPPR
jgi:hypothetical protein